MAHFCEHMISKVKYHFLAVAQDPCKTFVYTISRICHVNQIFRYIWQLCSTRPTVEWKAYVEHECCV